MRSASPLVSSRPLGDDLRSAPLGALFVGCVAATCDRIMDPWVKSTLRGRPLPGVSPGPDAGDLLHIEPRVMWTRRSTAPWVPRGPSGDGGPCAARSLG